MSTFWKVSGKKIELPELKKSDGLLELRPGGWVVFKKALPGGGYSQVKFSVQEVKKQIHFQWGGLSANGEWFVPERGVAGGTSGGDSDLTAQFPGKVRKVLVSEGQAIVEGEKLMLLEAMKMEFAVNAPYSGIVKKILVSEGQQLSPGTRLVDIEALKK